MAFVWVQQWVALPIVYEQQMGDLPPNSRSQAVDNSAHGVAREGNPSVPSSTPYKPSLDSTAPFYSQLSALPQGQPRQDFRSSTQPAAYYQNQEPGASSFNMGSIAGAIPDYGSSEDASHNALSQAIPRTLSGASPSAVAYQLGQNLQMPTHGSSNLPTHSPYGPNFTSTSFQQTFLPPQSSQHGNYASFGANQPRLAGPTPYQSYPQSSQYLYFPSPYGHQGQYATAFAAQGAQTQAMYGRKANTNLGVQAQSLEYLHNDGAFPGMRMGSSNFQGDSGSVGGPYGAPYAQALGRGTRLIYNHRNIPLILIADRNISGMPRSGPASSIPRGPPRKPKQSGHALWVGNLPPGTTVVALKDHFSRDATKDIESLFLISKSNCAFVNYRTEESCTAAMHRFHDSRFNGVRLVCRLRRSSAPASGVPTGPSAMMGSQQQNISRPATPRQDSVSVDPPDAGAVSPSHEGSEDRRLSADTTNKYFIVKSLTLQDLELSVRNGIWATQSHNEEVLNKAFRVSFEPTSTCYHLLIWSTVHRERLPHILGEQIWGVLRIRPHGVTHPRGWFSIRQLGTPG
jgi:hypothetical protein